MDFYMTHNDVKKIVTLICRFAFSLSRFISIHLSLSLSLLPIFFSYSALLFFSLFTHSICFIQEWFIGHELFDREATIVHHFAFHHDPSSFKYPLLDAGVLLSWPAVKRYHRCFYLS